MSKKSELEAVEVALAGAWAMYKVELAKRDARIAALEKCIEARDALIAQAYGDDSTEPESCECPDCKLRIAIRRADEEAGRV